MSRRGFFSSSCRSVPRGPSRDFTFKSWADMVAFCKNAKPRNGAQACSINGSEHFTMTKSWDHCLDMAVNGWPDMARRASTIARPIYAKISNLVQHDNINYGVEGPGIDVGRYAEGIPECRQVFDPVINSGKSNRVLTMIVNVGALCTVNADTMATKGAFALAIMDLLELSGYRVMIKAVSIAECGNTIVKVFATIKEADQIPDKNRLAFCMAHPSVLRRLVFRIRESIGKNNNAASIEYEPQPGEIYIPSGNHFHGCNQGDIESTILEELEKHGILNQKAR